ncbi:MAG: T9SS type A sorting domain-containing protein, partial [Candidatus Marinimicrobia bacterium]|nr:T9SS type A sorting domain-containing protein [Candidatus Neomarinimicrobiota bacterium]
LPEEILFIPWNVDSMGNVSYTLDPEGRVGPQNFQVSGDTLFLLDQQNESIQTYNKNRFVEQLPVIREAKDFIIQSSREYICLADNALLFYRNRKLVEKVRRKSPLPVIQKIYRESNRILAINHDGTVSKIENRRLLKSSRKGIPVLKNRYNLRKISRASALITIHDENGSETARIPLTIKSNNLGSFELIGADKSGRLFIDFSLITQDIPLKVRREIWILDQAGEELGKITIPTHYYAMTWNDLRITDDGTLYHMLSSEDGIHIIKWDLSQRTSDSFKGVYPEKYQNYLHYNEAVQPESLEKKSPLSKPTSSVTRSEALAIGDTYAVHEWSCTSANLTGSSGVTAPDGLTIITPSWIQVGNNVRVPYKWGGFNTLPEFDSGLLNGKYAGDRYTSKSCGSSYAVGVDCSGFVSRCWKLSSHYSTRMMDDEIAVAYASWEDLKPGDAIHKPGHVRLAVDNNANGMILAVEAAGSSTDWRVNYRTYSYTALANYTPRYYINMIGPGIPLAQPILLSTVKDRYATVDWSLASTDNVDGFLLKYINDSAEWSPFWGDSLLPVENNRAAFSYNTDEPIFFQMTAVNDDDERIESLPSDAYGFYLPQGYSQKILIVDGFDRIESSGSYHLPYHSFALWIGQFLFDLHVPFETAANDAVISGDVDLNEYQGVYWILGDESTVDETFSTVEQNLVKEYLKNGGQLFVSGSEIAWDLDYKGGASDKSFFLNYLRADYKLDNAGSNQVTGADGGIFDGLPFEFDDGSGGIYEEDYPDVIDPMMSAVACLKYSTGTTAGIQYEGLFPEGTVSGKLVYIGFPWETITDDMQKKIMLQKISEWFGFTCEGVEPGITVIPDKPFLSRGYPNPFNDLVNFQLLLPDAVDFNVQVYNSLGQKVRTIASPVTMKNKYQLSWNGTNDQGLKVASGCYFFQVALERRVLTEKIVFLK